MSPEVLYRHPDGWIGTLVAVGAACLALGGMGGYVLNEVVADPAQERALRAVVPSPDEPDLTASLDELQRQVWDVERLLDEQRDGWRRCQRERTRWRLIATRYDGGRLTR